MFQWQMCFTIHLIDFMLKIYLIINLYSYSSDLIFVMPRLLKIGVYCFGTVCVCVHMCSKLLCWPYILDVWLCYNFTYISFVKRFSNTVKPVLSGHSKRRPKIVFQDPLWLNAGQKFCRMLQGEHSAILSTFIKLPFVIKIFVWSMFEWPLKTGFTVYQNITMTFDLVKIKYSST